ncbi:MAG: type II toxin-antitoxin system PemK/MazF family toxin [Candidatus Altimarinota bacterium]
MKQRSGQKIFLTIHTMKRGEIWWVSFDPSLHSEIKKTRPAIIISIDLFNDVSRRVQVVPLSSNTQKLYPSESYVLIGKQKSKAMVDQIATVDKSRLQKKLSDASKEDLSTLERILKRHLGIS